jgi:hypothetical protein
LDNKQEKDPWRFYKAEHLWKEMAIALEGRDIMEQKLYLHRKIISLFLERDELMELFHKSKSDKMKDAMLVNLTAVNQQIDSLLIFIDEEERNEQEQEREQGSVDDNREPSPGGLEDGRVESV